MAKKGPRVPLPATIKLPGIERTIQVNHCKMPDCSNFGIPARTKQAKPGPSRGRDPHYKVHSTKAGTVPSVRCKACKDNPPVKSNDSIVQEVERLAEESGIWRLLESTSCGNGEFVNHGRPIDYHHDEYCKRGKPPSGNGHYHQCKNCGRRTLASDPIRLHDHNRRYAVDLLGRIANKAPVRRSYRSAKLNSPQAYYNILNFLQRRCRSYSGTVDRALIDGRLRLPADLNVQSDAQTYLLNWISRMDRRNVELSTNCTVDADSSFILGMHCNFDGRVDPFEINMKAFERGDLDRPEAFRKYGHYWLPGDELRAGRAMARRKERARIDLITQIEELYASAESREDVENIELQALDTTYTTPDLSTGLQVHMPYTAYAHWFLMHRMLTGAGVEQVQLNSDIDSMTRAAFLTVVADEVKRGDAHAFFVKCTKWETIDERREILQASKRKLADYRLAAPGRIHWSRQKLARKMMKEYITERGRHGKWDDEWAIPPPADRQRATEGHVLADAGRSRRGPQGGPIPPLRRGANRQCVPADPVPHQCHGTSHRRLQHARQGLARLRTVQPGNAHEVSDHLPGGSQFRVRRRRRLHASHAAGVCEAATRLRGHRLAWAAGPPAQAGAEAGEEGDCGVSITRGKSQQRGSRTPLLLFPLFVSIVPRFPGFPVGS